MAKKKSTPVSQKRKPRLLWANPFCLLDTSSGASMTVRQMLKQLVRAGYEIEVLGATIFDNPKGSGLFQEKMSLIPGAKMQLTEVFDDELVHKLLITKNSYRNELTAQEESKWFSQYCYMLDHFKPDIVWFYGGQTLDLLIADEARTRGIPSAFYLANGQYATSPRWCRDIDLVLTDSQATASMYRDKVGFIATPLGKFIDPQQFVAEHREPKRILFINPSFEKGASIVIQLALQLEKKRPDIEIEVVEARADWQQVLRTTTHNVGKERSSLPNVIVTPNTKDMREPYSRARVLLAPSLWWESSGRVLAEAMLNGIPAIVTNRGGMPEMIEDAGIKLDFPEACYEKPYQHLLSEQELAPLMEAVTAFYDDEVYYQSHVERAMRVGREKHHISVSTNRLTQALAPLVTQKAGNKDFRVSQRKQHKHQLAGIAAKPKFSSEFYVTSPTTAQQKVIAPAMPTSVPTLDFDWQLSSKVVVLDNRAKLIKTGSADKLVNTNAFTVLAFDPACEIANAKTYEGHEHIQLFQHALLGDGHPAKLNVCLDPALSSPLALLPESALPEHRRKGAKVLTQLPINTIALDRIEGLPSLDWLILDELSDAATILANGEATLKDTLLIQARVAFQTTHEKQPSLTELQHWASRNGFRFYRLNDIKNYSLIPKSINIKARPATEQESADVLFLPSQDRIVALSNEQKLKLAFILSTVFEAKDMTYALLSEIAGEKALEYLFATGLVEQAKPKSCFGNVDDLIKYLESVRLLPMRANHKLSGELIVSLTSYKSRFDNLHLTLRSLLLQKIFPDKLILWVAENERDDLPEKVWELEEYGLSIRFCDDVRSYKKIIPTLRESPDSFIVTADDDLYYEQNWLKELIENWDGDYKMIIAHRAHKIKFSGSGGVLPYQEWKWQVKPDEPVDGLIFPTTGAGVLYPPSVFHKDVTDEKKFLKLCPDADDIWLYWMASLNGAKAKCSSYEFRLIEWPSQNATSLWKKNIHGGGNDRGIKNMQAVYGFNWLFSKKKNNFSVPKYWDQRYKNGGNSGAGSYGRLAIFKAKIINDLIKEKLIDSVIEFGCGDGNQLRLMSSVSYLGVDISPTAVNMCREKFCSDKNKEFITLDEFKKSPSVAFLTLSLDVIYHLVDDDIYHDYMERLFSSAKRYCLVYSANVDQETNCQHVRKRKFTAWVEQYAPGWNLVKYIPNQYPMTAGSDPNNTSFADFYLFCKE